jgi:hypothetical protein
MKFKLFRRNDDGANIGTRGGKLFLHGLPRISPVKFRSCRTRDDFKMEGAMEIRQN